jgi:hypothetical protein
MNNGIGPFNERLEQLRKEMQLASSQTRDSIKALQVISPEPLMNDEMLTKSWEQGWDQSWPQSWSQGQWPLTP